MRVQRGTQVSHAGRSLSLIEAEALISRGLRKNSEDAQLLTARGEANLLEGFCEAAITDMEEALDTQPSSAIVLNGLAAAYFERAEAENRFEDYGTAYELQSRALQHSPDDPLILFNRAITSARLFLYKQSIKDFQRYLAMDPSGGWSREARQRLEEVQEVVAAHDRRTSTPLLTPAEFVQQVNPADARTWDAVEPRIEEYLSTAVTEWLPAAFPVRGKGTASPEAKQALTALAAILKGRHQDSWLTELLPATSSESFSPAIAALSNAVKADNADYALGRKEASRAAHLFHQSNNSAGESRSELEEIYAMRLSNHGTECLDQIAKLSPPLERSQYLQLKSRIRLERYNCLVENGDLKRSDQLDEAYALSNAANYASLQLRLLSTLAIDDLFKGVSHRGLAVIFQHVVPKK